MKFRIFLTTIFLIAGLGLYVYMNSLQNDPIEVVTLIQRNINPKDGSLMDYAGDINFRGFDSVGYEPINENKVRIYFGDLQFDLNKKDFENEKLMNSLEAIGFDITHGESGDFIVKYHGKQVRLFGEEKK